MTPVETLILRLRTTFPTKFEAQLEKPKNAEGLYWLDLRLSGTPLVVVWSPSKHFGIYTPTDEAAYGEGPNEFHEKLEDAFTRIVELLGPHENPTPFEQWWRVHKPKEHPSWAAMKTLVEQAYEAGRASRKGIRGVLEDVAAFHDACEVPVLEVPQLPERDRQELRVRLIQEEWEESLKALDEEDLVGVADGFVDTVYVLGGSMLEFGIPPEVWDEVQGKVIQREDGKVLKPEGWKPPNVPEVLRKHGWK